MSGQCWSQPECWIEFQRMVAAAMPGGGPQFGEGRASAVVAARLRDLGLRPDGHGIMMAAAWRGDPVRPIAAGAMIRILDGVRWPVALESDDHLLYLIERWLRINSGALTSPGAPLQATPAERVRRSLSFDDRVALLRTRAHDLYKIWGTGGPTGKRARWFQLRASEIRAKWPETEEQLAAARDALRWIDPHCKPLMQFDGYRITAA